MLDIRVDESKCNGCKRCEAVCALGHAVLQGMDFSAKNRVRILNEDSFNIRICRHCEDPACVKGCVAGALSIDGEHGVVRLDTDRCVGCYSCVMECPFRAVSISGKASKCDGCAEIGHPLCAQYCQNGAISATCSEAKLCQKRRRNRAVSVYGVKLS